MMNYEISPSQYNDMLVNDESHILIDVREPDEINNNIIANSINIPYSNFIDLMHDYLQNYDDERLILLCAHGIRSMKCTALLRNMDVANSFSIKGGLYGLQQFTEDIQK